jgi:short-subunit dehydrogenase
MKLDGSRILITGAGSGIGRSLALELSRRGAKVALAGRDLMRLRGVAAQVHAGGGTASCLGLDLAQPTGHADFVELAAAALGGIDALVNNAGISHFAAFAAHAPAAIRELIDVNVTGTLLLTQAALPYFLRQKTGHVVIVGAIVGSVGFPHFAAYSASKFALRGFAEALRRELADTGLRVTYVAPRATATGMNSAAVRALYAETGTGLDAPETVAVRVAVALAADRAEAYVGSAERWLSLITALFPRHDYVPLRRRRLVPEGFARAAAP